MVRVRTIMQLSVTQHRFLLCKDAAYKETLKGMLQGLADSEAIVRAAAKGSLTPLLLSATEEECA